MSIGCGLVGGTKHRDYRNVHADAQRLVEVGAIDLEPRPNRVVPRVVAAAIDVEV